LTQLLSLVALVVLPLLLLLQFEAIQVTRFLVSIEATGLPLTLVLNKCDLVSPEELEARLQQVASWGYKAVAVSAVTGEGLEELEQRMMGRVSVVAGPSGAGKSSLINALRLGQHREQQEEQWQWQWEEEALDDEVGWASASSSGEGCAGKEEQREELVAAKGAAQVPASWGEVGVSQTATEKSAAAGMSALVDGNGSRSSWGEVISDREALRPSSRSSLGASDTESSSGSSSEHGHTSSNQKQETHVPGDFLVVGEMSKIGRGMHTTRTVTLLQLPKGGAVADTPGFGLPTLDGVSSRQLESLFPEFEAAAEAAAKRCRFDDCMHVAEPDCVVLDAALERHPYYMKFLAEIKVGWGSVGQCC
jgi:ribosome biogenesis GTPase